MMKRDKSVTWHRIDAASLNLKGLKVAIVGGTGGIGRALGRFMAARGASVLVVGQTFRDSDVPGIAFIKADLSLMREAQRVAVQLPAEELDLLVFTTGIMAGCRRGPHRQADFLGKLAQDRVLSLGTSGPSCLPSKPRRGRNSAVLWAISGGKVPSLVRPAPTL